MIRSLMKITFSVIWFIACAIGCLYMIDVYWQGEFTPLRGLGLTLIVFLSYGVKESILQFFDKKKKYFLIISR